MKSQIGHKMAESAHKTTLKKKVQKTKTSKKRKILLRNESKTNIMDILSHIFPIRDHIYNTVFCKLQFLFSVLGSIFSRNRCKLRPKLRNAPLRSKFQIFLKF